MQPGVSEGNVSGVSQCSVHAIDEIFEAYDELDRPLRDLLKDAPFDCNPMEIAEYRQTMSLPMLCRAMIDGFTDAVREERGAWGPGYPRMGRYTPPRARDGAATSRTRYRRARLIL